MPEELLTIEHRSLPAEQTQWRFTNGPEIDGTFAGYLSIHGVTDSYGTRMMAGCWRSGGLDETKLYPLLDMHDSTSAVRSVLGGFHAKEDERGLFIEGQFAATAAGQDARTVAGMGFAPELSVGFVRLAAQEDDPDALISCKLIEGSLIIKGMASTPGAELVSVRSVDESSVEQMQSVAEDAIAGKIDGVRVNAHIIDLERRRRYAAGVRLRAGSVEIGRKEKS